MIGQTKENGITMITLVITIIVLIILTGVSINTLIGDNGIITEAKRAKENYELAQEEEKEALNSLYVQMVTELGSTESDAGNGDTESSETGTATSEQILEGYTAYQGGQLVTGSMTNRGAVMKELSAGESYTIPEGYHNGSGIVTAKDLASQTVATATADDILEGKTAWVDGTKLTGTNKGYDAGYSDASVEKYSLFFSKDGKGTTGSSVTTVYCYLSNYTEDYADLTSANIILDIFHASHSINCNSGSGGAFSLSYDASTSLISISTPSALSFYGSSATVPCYIVR